MSSPQSKSSKKNTSPRKRRTIYGWTTESITEAVKAGTLPAALQDKRAYQTLEHVRSNVASKVDKSADRLLNKRLKAYPVPDSTLQYEPPYTAEYIEKFVFKGIGAGLHPHPPLCRAHGMPDDAQYGMLLQVWEFVRSFAAAELLDGSTTACGDHMVKTHAAVPTDEQAVQAAAAVLAPEDSVVSGAGGALATPVRSGGKGGASLRPPGSAARSVRKLAASEAKSEQGSAPSEDEMLSRVNPWLVGVSQDTVAKLTTSLQSVELEDLITAFSSEAWRGHRLVTRVHMALLRLLLEQMEGPQDDAAGGGADDDEEDFLFGATAGDTGALAPTLALLSPLTWPEVLRLVLLHTPEGLDLQDMGSPSAVAAVKALKHTEYFALPLAERLEILQLLVDAASGTKSVAGTVKARLARQDALNRKRSTEEKRMNTIIKKDAEACARRLEKRKEREAAMKEKLAAMGGVKKAAKGGSKSASGEAADASAALMQGAATASLRSDIEKELSAAAAAKDLERLQAAMSSARESGCGFEEGRGKNKRMDAPMTAAAIALSQLRGEADRHAVEEAASFKRFRLAAKYAAKLNKVATSAECLGTDRHGSKYWRFHADPTRIYVERVKRDAARTAAAVALAQQAALERLGEKGLEPPPDTPTAAAAGGDEEDDGKKSRRGARFSAEAVAAELRGSAAADAVLTQVLLAAHDPQHTDSEWGFIDTVEGLEALLKSLDKRGQNERALFECLELHLRTIEDTLWTAAYKRQHIEATLQERGMPEKCLEELVGAPVPKREPDAEGGEGGVGAATGGVKRSRQSIIEQARDAALARELADAEDDEPDTIGGRSKRPRRGAAVAAAEKLSDTSTAFARGGGDTAQSGQADLALAEENTVNAAHPLDLLPAAVAQSIAVRSQLLTLCESFAKRVDPPSRWLAGEALDTSAPVRSFMEKFPAEGTDVPSEADVPSVREEHGLCAAGRTATPQEAMTLEAWTAATAAAVTGSAQASLLLALEGHMYALQRGEAASARAAARRARLVAAAERRAAAAGDAGDADAGGADSDGEDFDDMEDDARPDGWSDGESDSDDDEEGGAGGGGASPARGGGAAEKHGAAGAGTGAGSGAEDSDGEGDGQGEEEDAEFAIEGDVVLWRYRSQRRRWRARVRWAVTLPCVAISAQELHERASAAGLAGVPPSLIARGARPWTVPEDDDEEEDEGGQGGVEEPASSEPDDDGDDIFEEEEED